MSENERFSFGCVFSGGPGSFWSVIRDPTDKVEPSLNQLSPSNTVFEEKITKKQLSILSGKT